ncbi:MAG: alpha/beta fold hydrolase [Solirubrobacterales bacterium]
MGDDQAEATPAQHQPEQLVEANGIEIAYDAFGDPSDPPMLLVMGLGMQMLGWDERFCSLLAVEGFHVIRFDNRDVGHSSSIEGGPKPKPIAAFLGSKRSASSLVEDLAADAAGLLDALEAPPAHIVGASLGGMIAQTIAIRHPERTRSLGSIMSTSGVHRMFPKLRALRVILSSAPPGREGYVEHLVSGQRELTGGGYPFDEARSRRLAGRLFDRGIEPLGQARQLTAIVSSGDRAKELRELRIPAVVIHGGADPLIPIRAGRATASAIPDSRFVEIPGMGHELPMPVWPEIVGALTDNARRAEEGA